MPTRTSTRVPSRAIQRFRSLGSPSAVAVAHEWRRRWRREAVETALPRQHRAASGEALEPLHVVEVLVPPRRTFVPQQSLTTDDTRARARARPAVVTPVSKDTECDATCPFACEEMTGAAREECQERVAAAELAARHCQ